jgi:hypothetical protein
LRDRSVAARIRAQISSGGTNFLFLSAMNVALPTGRPSKHPVDQPSGAHSIAVNVTSIAIPESKLPLLTSPEPAFIDA